MKVTDPVVEVVLHRLTRQRLRFHPLNPRDTRSMSAPQANASRHPIPPLGAPTHGEGSFRVRVRVQAGDLHPATLERKRPDTQAEALRRLLVLGAGPRARSLGLPQSGG